MRCPRTCCTRNLQAYSTKLCIPAEHRSSVTRRRQAQATPPRLRYALQNTTPLSGRLGGTTGLDAHHLSGLAAYWSNTPIAYIGSLIHAPALLPFPGKGLPKSSGASILLQRSSTGTMYRRLCQSRVSREAAYPGVLHPWEKAAPVRLQVVARPTRT